VVWCKFVTRAGADHILTSRSAGVKGRHMVMKAPIDVKWPHGSERPHVDKGAGVHRGEHYAWYSSHKYFACSASELISFSPTLKMMAPPLNVVHYYFSRSS